MAMKCAGASCGNYIPECESGKCSACERGYVMRTADHVEITHGLAVWTNDLEPGTVDLTYSDRRQDGWPPAGEFWFYVRVLGQDRPVMQSESRVATVHPFTREPAAEIFKR